MLYILMINASRFSLYKLILVLFTIISYNIIQYYYNYHRYHHHYHRHCNCYHQGDDFKILGLNPKDPQDWITAGLSVVITVTGFDILSSLVQKLISQLSTTPMIPP